MTEEQVLKNWTSRYLKHKDIIIRKIKTIEDQGRTLLVKKEDQNIRIIPQAKLIELNLSEINQKEKTLIITFNTKENLKTLISIWTNINNNDLLTIYFINPESTHDKRWIIHPKAHSLIADENTIAQGLRSLFATVDEINPTTIKKLVKNTDN